MKIRNILYAAALSFAATAATAAQPAADSLYREPYRPQYHFSPQKGWIGDPCGFIHYGGKYHMYWWGKAESSDLVHYEEISPFAMTGADSTIAYFSGSAVVDRENTAGFGRNAFVAAYTIYEKESRKQAQGISVSHDEGRTFRYFEGNPVVDIGSTEFRDPTVFWHDPTQKWVMVVAEALEKRVKFYTSPDLRNWTWTGDFGPAGDSEKSWECPDLFRLPVDGNPEDERWVLVVSVNWAREQYFIGDFDGECFRLADDHPAEPLYVDRGLDFYASRTFQDFDGTLADKISMGWVTTWDYAQSVPSAYGKGFWSLPRVLRLKTCPEGLRMVQHPVEGLKTLRHDPVSITRRLAVGTHELPGFAPEENTYELDAVFSTTESNTFGFNLCAGEGRKVVVSYDTDSHTLVVDRTRCSDVDIPKFARMAHARVDPVDGALRLHIFVDKSSVEIFVNEGREVFTLLTYAAGGQTGIEVFALKKGTHLRLDAWMLRSVW